MLNNKNLKISDYIKSNDWYSFIEQSILNCPYDLYSQLLEQYFQTSAQYHLYFDLSHALLASDMIGQKDATKTYQKNNITPRPVGSESNALVKNYTWPNGFEFLNQLFDICPEIEHKFIEHSQFIEKTHLMVLNYNIYIGDNCVETQAFDTFFIHLFENMSKTQFNTFYQKNDLYVNQKHTPEFRSLLNKFHLEHQLELSKKMSCKKKI